MKISKVYKTFAFKHGINKSNTKYHELLFRDIFKTQIHIQT